MIKIALRHPSGLELEFEGDSNEFSTFTQFLSASGGTLLQILNPAIEPKSATPELKATGNGAGTSVDENAEPADATVPMGADGEIDARAVSARVAHLQATTDIERVTIIAQAAIDAGLDGIDYDTIEGLYGDLGIPKPARFAKAFSNAKQRGLVKSVKFGVWAPTVQGENYALYGRKPSGRRTGKRSPDNRPTSGAPPELERGEDLSDE